MAKLPRAYEAFKRSYPEIWKAYDRLGILSHEAGPLDRKTRELVKLALAIGGKLASCFGARKRRPGRRSAIAATGAIMIVRLRAGML